jgi:cellulose synthase/poly-beta-1,6-N-acetylglucosamine synthase-like glycosyltransferase
MVILIVIAIVLILVYGIMAMAFFLINMLSVLFNIFIFLFIFLILIYCALFVLYSNGWKKLATFQFTHQYQSKTKVSVIIPARNEQQHIKNCIDSILLQKFTGFLEIIVVNDYSTDNTLQILQSYGNAITIIDLQKEIAQNKLLNAYKKKAIEMAVQKAQGDLIITTDADTIRNQNWVASFVQCYEANNYKIIAGPVNYTTQNSVLHYFQIIDFITMQGITAASLYYHFNSTCNGANLAYSKQAFMAVNGFAGIDDIASGDDMLLLHKIEKKYPRGAYYLKSKAAIVTTYAMPTISSFLQQRIRWASKAKYYTDKRVTAVLAAVFLFNIALAILAIMVCCGRFSLFHLLIILAIKIVVEWQLVKPVTDFFDKQKFLIWHIILQPIHVLYIIICGFLGQITTYTWKGRQVK